MLEPLQQTVEGLSKSYEISSLPDLDDRWDATAIEPIEAAYIRSHVDAFASH